MSFRHGLAACKFVGYLSGLFKRNIGVAANADLAPAWICDEASWLPVKYFRPHDLPASARRPANPETKAGLATTTGTPGNVPGVYPRTPVLCRNVLHELLHLQEHFNDDRENQAADEAEQQTYDEDQDLSRPFRPVRNPGRFINCYS